jgi:hypothetical protein
VFHRQSCRETMPFETWNLAVNVASKQQKGSNGGDRVLEGGDVREIVARGPGVFSQPRSLDGGVSEDGVCFC